MSLVLKEIRKSFRQGESEIQVLKNASAQIASGSVVAIVGQSGSGKSTLLSLLSGLEKADGGQIWIDGTDLCGLSEREMTLFRANHIAIVFQQYHLLAHLTARENVALAMEILKKGNAEAKAEFFLKELGLGHRLDHLPTQLSGGESQRVAIARALVVQPKLLLCDEPSGNLDQQTGEKVMELLFQEVRKYHITTILVTHSEALAQKCDRILYLRDGRLESEL